MNQGVESFFSTVVTAKKISIKELESKNDDGSLKYDNPLLTITDDDRISGYKHVFQTKGCEHERIRSSIGMWSHKETYIDNCAQNLIDSLHKYYD